MSTKQSQHLEHIVIIGSGQWAQALTHIVSTNAKTITILAREESPNLNNSYFQKPNTKITTNPEVISTANLIFSAIPAQAFTPFIKKHAPHFAPCIAPLIQTAKGIDLNTHQLLIDCHLKHLPTTPVAILSGPGFSVDVLHNEPLAVTIAAGNIRLAQELCEQLATPTFRPYASDDLIGVSLGGALKNIYAIACGMATGLGLGDSARAALITRSFAEMGRITQHFGGQTTTLNGLSGLGDLILTASSEKSRNFAYGVSLIKGAPCQNTTIEGIKTALALSDMLSKTKQDTPILDALVTILTSKTQPSHQTMLRLITTLMQRPIKAEGQTPQ